MSLNERSRTGYISSTRQSSRHHSSSSSRFSENASRGERVSLIKDPVANIEADLAEAWLEVKEVTLIPDLAIGKVAGLLEGSAVAEEIDLAADLLQMLPLVKI